MIYTDRWAAPAHRERRYDQPITRSSAPSSRGESETSRESRIPTPDRDTAQQRHDSLGYHFTGRPYRLDSF